MTTTKQKQQDREFCLALAKKSWDILLANDRQEEYADVLIAQQEALGVK
ncbi:hypothetical protein [Weissella muntiaci]|nr:hypothetical protein [Weissella muntiaci]